MYDNYRASLFADVSRVVEQIADTKAVASHAREKGRSFSAELATLAIRAFYFGEHEAVADQFKGRDDWDKAKGTFSGAIGLAKFLIAGNRLPAPKGDKTVTTLHGQAVTHLDKASVELLAFPQIGDTTVPALVKHMRAVVKARAERAEAIATARDNALAAYLASPDGVANYAGEDVTSLPALIGTDFAELVRVIGIGEEILRERQAQADAKAQAEAQTDKLVTVLAFIAQADAQAVDQIMAALAKREADAQADAIIAKVA